jgi:hypothetical protein
MVRSAYDDKGNLINKNEDTLSAAPEGPRREILQQDVSQDILTPPPGKYFITDNLTDEQQKDLNRWAAEQVTNKIRDKPFDVMLEPVKKDAQLAAGEYGAAVATATFPELTPLSTAIGFGAGWYGTKLTLDTAQGKLLDAALTMPRTGESPAGIAGSGTIPMLSGPNGAPTVNVPYNLSTNPNTVSPLVAANQPLAPTNPASALDAMLSPNASAAALNALIMPPATGPTPPPVNQPAALPTLTRP